MSDIEFPRRCYLHKMTPAELAIFEAIQAVEKLPPDVRLTEAVVFLSKATDRVADFVDGINNMPSSELLPDPPELKPRFWDPLHPFATEPSEPTNAGKAERSGR